MDYRSCGFGATTAAAQQDRRVTRKRQGNQVLFPILVEVCITECARNLLASEFCLQLPLQLESAGLVLQEYEKDRAPQCEVDQPSADDDQTSFHIRSI